MFIGTPVGCSRLFHILQCTLQCTEHVYWFRMFNGSTASAHLRFTNFILCSSNYSAIARNTYCIFILHPSLVHSLFILHSYFMNPWIIPHLFFIYTSFILISSFKAILHPSILHSSISFSFLFSFIHPIIYSFTQSLYLI